MILSIFHHKGGVGKTSIVDGVAHSILLDGNKRLRRDRVLIVDLDPQMNISCKSLGSEDKFEKYIEDLKDLNDFKHNKTNPDIRTKIARLMNYQTMNDLHCNPIPIHEDGNTCIHLLPGHPDLSQLMRQMALELDSPKVPLNHCLAINLLIKMYCKQYGYDLVLLDLGPNLYELNISALLTSDFCLMPCTPDMYSSLGFKIMREVVFDKFHHRFRNHVDLKIIGFVPNRISPGEASQQRIDMLHTRFLQQLGPFCINPTRTHQAVIPEMASMDHRSCHFNVLVAWLNQVIEEHC
jgi:cellulose biosynthesis protein BcsQ